jgi:hypothetical protein
VNEREHTVALRVVLAGVLLAWLWKVVLLAQALAFAVHSPLRDPFFPALLQRPHSLALALLLPPMVSIPALLRSTGRRLKLALCVTASSALLLLLHQATYNDASFLTAFWSSLFGLCLHAEAPSTSRASIDPARLARVLVALMFLGGFIGKLTPGYWDGTVFYQLYFAERAYWTFALARWLFEGEQLRHAASVYSRVVVCSEALLVTLPLWPARAGLTFAVAALLGMVLLNNPLLLSVLGPLLGVCVAALYCEAGGTARSRKIRAASAYSTRSGSAAASVS